MKHGNGNIRKSSVATTQKSHCNILKSSGATSLKNPLQHGETSFSGSHTPVVLKRIYKYISRFYDSINLKIEERNVISKEHHLLSF
jgi:hypothetical protein